MTYVDCGPYEINFTYEDGSSIDRELFEDDQITYPNFKFGAIKTDDVQIVDSYKFKFQIWLANELYSKNLGTSNDRPF